MSDPNEPKAGWGRRVVLVRPVPEAGGTPDHTAHLVELPFGEHCGEVSGLCGVRLDPGRVETVVPGAGVRHRPPARPSPPSSAPCP